MHIKVDTKTQKARKKIFLQKNTEKISDHHLEVNPVLVKFVYKTKKLKKQGHFYYDKLKNDHKNKSCLCFSYWFLNIIGTFKTHLVSVK